MSQMKTAAISSRASPINEEFAVWRLKSKGSRSEGYFKFYKSSDDILKPHQIGSLLVFESSAPFSFPLKYSYLRFTLGNEGVCVGGDDGNSKFNLILGSYLILSAASKKNFPTSPDVHLLGNKTCSSPTS